MMAAQILALGTAIVLAAFPVRAFLLSPETPLAAKLVWAALALAAVVRPIVRAPVLILLTPCLPWLPFAVEGMPHGVVHLLVLSQAIPWLAQRAFDRRAAPVDAMGRLWLLFLLTALCSAAPFYAAFALRFDGLTPFLADLSDQLARYVQIPPSIEIANLLAACAAFGDAVLAWLIVRTSPNPTLRLVRLAAIAAIFVACVGVWQAFTGVGLRPDWRLNDPYITRINGTFSDPNALAAYLAALTPMLAALAGRAAGRLRHAWLAGFAIVLLAIVLTAGRVGLLGALIGVAVTALGALRHRLDQEDTLIVVRRHFRRAVMTAFVLGVAGVAALTAAGTALDARHHQQQSHVDTWLYTFNLRRPLDETAKGRLGIWRTVGHIVRDHPMFGVGPGLIFRVFPGYSQDVPEAPQGISLSAHNTFLNVTAELGLVGLAVWLALLATIVVAVWRSSGMRADPDRDGGAWIGVGLLGAWAAVFVTMTTGDRTILREDLVLLGVLSALVARRALLAPPSRTTRALLAAAAILLIVATPFRMRAASGEVRLDRMTVGLHAPERARDGSMFRWTTDRAVFHLPPSTTVLTLRVRALAPYPQTVRVLVRNAEVGKIDPPNGAWVSTRIVLPRPRDAEYHRIEVLVSPTWKPPNDGRELGVMLAWEAR
jgi:O-antigen ligase